MSLGLLLIIGVLAVVIVIIIIALSKLKEDEGVPLSSRSRSGGSRSRSERELQDKISNLSLYRVREKIREKEGWGESRIDNAENLYRQFLLMIGTADQMIGPLTADMDVFWHYHIQDTAKYQDDCDRLFGRYIHHNPHLTGDEDQVVMTRTRTIYLERYGSQNALIVFDGGCGVITPFGSCAADAQTGSVIADSPIAADLSSVVDGGGSSAVGGDGGGDGGGGGGGCGGGGGGCGGGGCGS